MKHNEDHEPLFFFPFSLYLNLAREEVHSWKFHVIAVEEVWFFLFFSLYLLFSLVIFE